MSKSVQEILDWIDEESADSLQNLRDEPDHNNNHLATAYSAEYDLLERLKDFMLEKS